MAEQIKFFDVRNSPKNQISEHPENQTQKKVDFLDWEKIDLRVGKIISAEDHPNADKLYVIEVDLGKEKRKLVAGLKAYYKPKELVGKLCVVFCNLEPAVLRGVKSEGMILAAVSEDKKDVKIIQPAKDIELGSRIQ
jgi:methionyl-tRNA synthetase